jgi:exonuclease VII small subunit
MLNPAQQRLPRDLEVPLEQAIQAWEKGQRELAPQCLELAMDLAGQMGYL